jgi:hypothetical protein
MPASEQTAPHEPVHFAQTGPVLFFSEDVKKSARRLFRQLPSDANAVNKICKSSLIGIWLLGVGPDRANTHHHLKAGSRPLDQNGTREGGYFSSGCSFALRAETVFFARLARFDSKLTLEVWKLQRFIFH